MLAALTLVLALTAAQTPRLGAIAFPNSGAPAAQQAFVTGVLYLHSFEYAHAAAAFREAHKRDSGFVLAYWGEAMTYNHPVWNEQDTAAARAALGRLAPSRSGRAALAATPRERSYLDAVETLYGEGPKARRDTLYATAMASLAAAYPQDHEAQAFYALALLGLHQGVRDVPTYLRAAALVEPVFRANPDHPGAAHYLIHAYDDPAHAERGLPAARAYATIAPDAAHAQHMTTHIFLALGMWDEVVKQNEIASGEHRAHWTPGHYTAWLGYGLLQQGRHVEARRHLEDMRTNLPRRNTPGTRAYLVGMRAHYLINAEAWDDPARGWVLDVTGLGATALAIDAFGLGYAALRRGDEAEARRRLGTLREITATTRVPPILALELEGALLVREGKDTLALARLREATTLEDALPVEFGPPDVVKPSHELLGEVLLGLGRRTEAERAFARALELAPGRALAQRGLAASRAAPAGPAR
jgi:tetratricopeptide (TPR) repeat protein